MNTATETQITVSPVLLDILSKKETINISNLLTSLNTEKVNILPATSDIADKEVAKEHDAEPIKKVEDIIRIRDYFIERKEYRNNMLFIVGINVGLRVSDLKELRFQDFINPNGTFKDELVILERKTKNTRKVKKNRHIGINMAVRQAIAMYLVNNPDTTLDRLLFESQSRNKRFYGEKPMSTQGIQDILTRACTDLNINIRTGTHMLRKTFSYHMIMQAKDRSRSIELLQKLLGHSSQVVTMKYAGITDDEITKAYADFNLGYEEVIEAKAEM